jgi:hypothetical protein
MWRRARDSNPQGPRGPVDFKSTALPVEASPPCPERQPLTIQQYLSETATEAPRVDGQVPKLLDNRDADALDGELNGAMRGIAR